MTAIPAESDPSPTVHPEGSRSNRPLVAWLHPSKTEGMRRLLHLVAHGSTWWTGGEVARTKAEALTLKFLDRYRIDASADQRWRAKRRGEASAALVMLEGNELADPLHWWLLATPGEGLVRQLETLRDATRKGQRIEHTGYELVQTPRKGALAAWTWRMTAATIDAWEERIRVAVRHRSEDQIRQVLYSLGHVPGFREIRTQAYRLHTLVRGEWQRTQHDPWPYEQLHVGWVGRYRQPKGAPVREAVRKRPRRAPPVVQQKVD
ncbi:MAG: hypothetical protein ACOYB3_09705 [Azonexus sp.]